MSALVRHAAEELHRAGLVEGDEYDQALARCVLALVEVLASQGHSGSTLPMVVRMFERLAQREPLTPLTGAPDEWEERPELVPGLLQNRRCSRVFRHARGGPAYDIGRYLFRDATGALWNTDGSRVEVAFPYLPEQIVVDSDTPPPKGQLEECPPVQPPAAIGATVPERRS
jgi:hypothetical protein